MCYSQLTVSFKDATMMLSIKRNLKMELKRSEKNVCCISSGWMCLEAVLSLSNLKRKINQPSVVLRRQSSGILGMWETEHCLDQRFSSGVSEFSCEYTNWEKGTGTMHNKRPVFSYDLAGWNKRIPRDR